MDTVQGKVAVVTGAASGIGRAMAERFAAEGAKVVMSDIEEVALDTAVSAVNAAGGEAVGVRCDVSDAAQVEALRDATVDAFGTAHIVCNNAGVGTGGKSWEQSLDDWHWVLGVNLWGVIHGVHAFTPLLLEQGEGHIVNTASMAGLVSPALMSPYNVSKHGVVTLSETLHAELAMEPGDVGVSVLCPGWVNTRIHEAARNKPASGNAPAAGHDEATAMFQEVLGTLLAEGLDPTTVADQVLDAVLTGRFYILTHPDWLPGITLRAEGITSEQGLPRPASLPAE